MSFPFILTNHALLVHQIAVTDEGKSWFERYLRGMSFYVRREEDLMKTAKVNAYIMHIFGKIELLSIHAT